MSNTILILQNFQRHRYRKIRLNHSVNIIVGPSDAGKSTIIRALYWLCFNKPGGDSFIKRGAKYTKVVLILNGRRIVRCKGKGKNYYSLDGKKYKAMGQTVPPEIQAALNLSPINFQLQDDASFWFTQTAGQVSKELNTVVNLDAIDRAIEKANKLKREASTTYQYTRGRLEQAKTERNQLLWVQDARTELDKLLAIETKQTEIRGRCESLAACITDARKLTERIDNAGKAAVELGYAAVVYGEIVETSKRLNNINEILSEHKELKKQTSVELPNLDELDSLFKKAKTLRSRIDFLDSSIEEIQQMEIAICEKEQLVKDGEIKLHKSLKGKCPLCNQTLPESKP